MRKLGTRISKGIVNSRTALGYTLVSYILAIFSRQVFLMYLGDDVMGLNSTLQNMLQMLNVLELGIASAIGVSLYQSFAKDDYEAVNEIVTIQRWYYRRIGLIVIGVGIILLAFFPFIFSDISFPLWWAVAGFGVVLANASLFYFVNYRQVVLTASQNEYLVYKSYRLVMLLKVVAQIFGVIYLPHKYLTWLAIEILFDVIAAAALYLTVKRNATYLKRSELPIATLKSRHPEIGRMLRQLCIHRFGGFSLSQSVPFIIYAYSSLTVVTLYFNYQMLFMACITIVNVVYGSLGAGVGNLIATEKPRKVYMVFSEIYGTQFLLVSLIVCSCYMFSDDIITMWLGSKYVVSHNLLLAMIAAAFFMMIRVVIDTFISAYGLFSDIWAPLTESVLNIGLSILLGYYYGITGVVMGVVITQFFFVLIWKPVFLFYRGIKRSVWLYFGTIVRNLGIMVITYIAVAWIVAPLYFFDSMLADTIVRLVIFAVCYLIVCHSLLSVSSRGMRMFNRRVYNYFRG